jgi:23S rRNA (adenine1618-N6)-methyltransferase
MGRFETKNGMFEEIVEDPALRSESTSNENVQDVARGVHGFPKNILPFHSEYAFTVNDMSIDQAAKDINSYLDAIEGIQWQWNPTLLSGTGFSMDNVWSRRARRKKNLGKVDESQDQKEAEIDEDEATFGFKVQLRQSMQQSSAELVIRWLKGDDGILFESFSGMLRRKMERR